MVTDKVQGAFASHNANPGPVIPENFNVEEQGTKEERKAQVTVHSKE